MNQRRRPWRPRRLLTQTDHFEIYEWATLGNMPLSEIADAYDVPEDEVEQIVLSFIPPKAD